MSGETNQFFCLRCRKECWCDPDDEQDQDYIKARREQGLCRDCYSKKKDGKSNAPN